jgi:hypothetical protein
LIIFVVALPMLAFAASLGMVLAVPRVVPLLHGWHFDDIQKDCTRNCPPVVIAFFSSSCGAEFQDLQFHEGGLPQRDHLFIGKYNTSAYKDPITAPWWTPLPRDDLAARFNIKDNEACPKIMFAPHMQWDKATFWDLSSGTPWRTWLREQLIVTISVKNSHKNAISVLLDKRSSDKKIVLEPGQEQSFQLKSGHYISAIDEKLGQFQFSAQLELY